VVANRGLEMNQVSPEVRLLPKSDLKPFVPLLKGVRESERVRILSLSPEEKKKDEAFKRILEKDRWWFVPPLIRH
jgi:hypothetical protein